MSFYFINNTQQKIPKRYFLFVLKDLIQKLKIENPFEVSLILTTPRQIQKLNKKYREKDEVTDVLSFPIDIKGPENVKKIQKDDKIILGDIYICPSIVKRNNPNNFKKELRFIFLHGLLHLLGYNHKNKNEQEQWERIIEKILK